MKLIVVFVLSFFIMLLIDKIITSSKFNARYDRQCIKAFNRLSEQQKEALQNWVISNVTVSDEEISYKDLKAKIPLELRYKLTEKCIRGLMKQRGYKVISDCFLDPACFYASVKSERNE